jgi:anti-sigma B factor antagonist
MTEGEVASIDSLEITVHHSDETSILHLRGRLNIDSSPALRDRLLSMLRVQSLAAVNVDLIEVTYMDSSAIATLIEALKIARTRQTKLCLQGLQGRLLHLFRVTGVLTLFEKNGCGSDSSVSQVS